jgi:GAF domain-containing protein/nitrogen-specific signal transduction histidine kinase
MDFDMESRLLGALASLNKTGRAINQIGSGEPIDEKAALQLIVESAMQVVPEASSVIYTYDERTEAFNPESRVSSGALSQGTPGDRPRFNGMGARAIQQRRRVLSYEEPDLEIDPKKVKAGARAVVCFPLIVADQPLGILYVYVAEERKFSQLELLMLENYVNQAAIAIYQVQRMAGVRKDLARKEEELKRLSRAGMIISSRLSLESTLESILQMALEVTNAEYGIFRLLEKGGNKLVTRAFAGENLGHPYVEELALDKPSVSAWVVKNRQPVLIPDLTVEPWTGIYYPLDADVTMRSELAVPLISAGGRLEGVLNLESPMKNAFSDEDRILLHSFATQAVIAIQEARLLDALQEIAQLLLTQTGQQVMERLAELACDLLNANASSIWILQEGQLLLQVTNRRSSHGEHMALADSFIQLAVQNQGPITIDRSVINQGPYASQPDLPEDNDWKQVRILPMTVNPEKGPVGAFCVYSANETSYQGTGTEWENKVLSVLAYYAAMAVFYSTHQEELRQAQEQRAVAEMFAAVGDIATNLLHQLNNKVGTIPVRIQGIQDKCQQALQNDRYLAHNLEEIERSATEAMVAVRENLSHLHPVQLVPVNVDSCVRAALSSARIGQGVTIQVENLEDLPDVAAGQHNLTLVFMNLIENASLAMKGNGTISISGASSDDWVEIAVSDCGPGIPPEVHERIFELNYSSGAPSQAGKLGFGLWWVRTLMMRLGGSVSVESDGQSGTTFRLRLPRGENKT